MRNINTNKSIRTAVVEVLESRELLSATPTALTVTQTTTTTGLTLNITGSSAVNNITVTQTSTGLVIGNTNGWTDTVTGTFNNIVINTGNANDTVTVSPSVKVNATIIGGTGNDTLKSGSGNDTIYAGTGTNTIYAGSGRDTVVTLGGTADTIYAGTGVDTFWIDNNTKEIVNNATSADAIHRISSFYGATATTTTATTTKAGKGRNFKGENHKKGKKSTTVATTALPIAPEPSVTTTGTTFKNFSSNPLFAANGPTQDDIRQGDVGDCYYLSTLAAIAKVDPTRIEQSIVQLADGTYVVQIFKGSTAEYVHVDGSLPTYGNGTPVYANFGQQNSMWVAIMEKAFADVRTGANSYASLNSGWMTESFSTFGLNSTGTYSFSNASQLLSTLQAELAANDAVTIGINTPELGAPLIGDHAYEVVATATINGTTDIEVRNPWGVDGVANSTNPNDGYVYVTPAQLFASEMGVVAAKA